MVVEIGDQLIGAFGSGSLSVGDVIESRCCLRQFVGQVRQCCACVNRQLAGSAPRGWVEDAGLLQRAGDSAQPVADRGSPVPVDGIVFRGRAMLSCG